MYALIQLDSLEACISITRNWKCSRTAQEWKQYKNGERRNTSTLCWREKFRFLFYDRVCGGESASSPPAQKNINGTNRSNLTLNGSWESCKNMLKSFTLHVFKFPSLKRLSSQQIKIWFSPFFFSSNSLCFHICASFCFWSTYCMNEHNRSESKMEFVSKL